MTYLEIGGKDGLRTVTALVLKAGGEVTLTKNDFLLADLTGLYTSINPNTGEVVLSSHFPNATTDGRHTMPR
jgi:hypothetical protein